MVGFHLLTLLENRARVPRLQATGLRAQDTYRFLKRQIRDKKNETFAALFLDNQHRVLAYEELFQGTINSASVYSRPLVQRVLQLNAATLILAHNHPSGLSNASDHDIAVTERMQKALELVDGELTASPCD